MAPLPWPPGSGCWDQAEVALTWRSLRAPYPLGSGCWDQAEVPLNWRSLQAPWPLILWVRPTSSIKVLCYGGKIQCIMQLLIPFVAYWTPMESALYNITFGCLNIICSTGKKFWLNRKCVSKCRHNSINLSQLSSLVFRWCSNGQ